MAGEQRADRCRKAGYEPVHRKGRPVGDEHPRRFEVLHRNAAVELG